ncbi:hypothetical protein [Luteimonas pelagia]
MRQSPAFRRLLALSAMLWLATSLAGCASTGQASALQQAQYAWSAAIRWGDFEGAQSLVDPDYRRAHPVTELELARYAQVQISGYSILAERATETQAQREVDIGVVNRHTLQERRQRYTERWRWDAEDEAWYIVDGLPDLWKDG